MSKVSRLLRETLSEKGLRSGWQHVGCVREEAVVAGETLGGHIPTELATVVAMSKVSRSLRGTTSEKTLRSSWRHISYTREERVRCV